MRPQPMRFVSYQEGMRLLMAELNYKCQQAGLACNIRTMWHLQFMRAVASRLPIVEERI